MAVVSAASGTQSATVGTEHTLTTQTTAGVYQLVVDTSNMALGDVLELRVKTKAHGSGATSQVAFFSAFAHSQTEPNKYSPAIMVDTEIVCTLKQTAGTGRSYAWNLLRAS